MNPDPFASFRLTGKTALVTGSSRGIGAAIAQGLAGAGARIVLHGQHADAAEPIHSSIVERGGTAWALGGDLRERGAGIRLLEEAERIAGPVDILIINASAQVNAMLADICDDDFDLQLDVNLRSTFEMLRHVLPSMASRGWGRVVNIGSINQLRPKSIVTAYAATKAAQHNLIQSQARDFAASNVLLNTLAPGLVDTDRNAERKAADPQGWDAYVRQLNWMGRAASAQEMVGAALFLSSDACSFMTGETIVLSGGY
ncbi:SDR family NAD(P)-dependent oxidoreductase [Nitratireductor soli]|uniref:SDR family NAD(P)-dependent oxidoreductase n=1 Tax=Nitratireductor soli TaxID=1670619 RepID=UPI00065E761B|nr:SDR family oxidoreductase [Nitratireductor soli]